MTIGRIPSVEGGIQPTILDAKGDLIVATAADTPARLAVGSNNLLLTADSNQATGLKWSSDWTSYTPTWGAYGTAPSLGNGTFTAQYIQIGKLVTVQIRFVAGSTTTFGTSGWTFTLPVTAKSQSNSVTGAPAAGYAEDAGVAGYVIPHVRIDGNQTKFEIWSSAFTSFSSTVPFTWASGDWWNIQFTYGVA